MRAKSTQLKHNWLEPKQIISGLWLLSQKKTQQKPQTKEAHTSCFIRNTGTGKRNTAQSTTEEIW